ncbi:MAG: hypothetical protein ACJA1E_001694 [Paracoccaceae bacterium]|jgi:hypothetical protein
MKQKKPKQEMTPTATPVAAFTLILQALRQDLPLARQ